MEEISEEGRKMMERAITQAYLLRLNRYALDNGLINDEMYRKMEVSLRVNYEKTERECQKRRDL